MSVGVSARRIAWIAGALVLLVGLPALWRWTPLSDWVTIENGAAWFSMIRSSQWVGLWMVVFYAVGAVLFLPINLFIFLTALFFDNLSAYLFVALGVTVNAATGYMVGRFGVSIAARKVSSERFERISSKLAGADFLELFLFRLIPVTPFSTLNVLCGLLKIPTLRFFGATLASIAPGATLIILFERALMAFADDMTWQTGLLLTSAIAVLAGAALFVKRRAALRHS